MYPVQIRYSFATFTLYEYGITLHPTQYKNNFVTFIQYVHICAAAVNTETFMHSPNINTGKVYSVTFTHYKYGIFSNIYSIRIRYFFAPFNTCYFVTFTQYIYMCAVAVNTEIFMKVHRVFLEWCNH